MIYLRNIANAQTMFVPKVVSQVVGDLTLIVNNTIDNEETAFTVVDLQTSPGYYRLAIALPDGIQSGEYKYTLSDASQVLSTGLVVINDETAPEEYENTIQYEQYESDI